MKIIGFKFLAAFGLLALLGLFTENAAVNANSSGAQSSAAAGAMVSCFHDNISSLNDLNNHIAAVEAAMNDAAFWDLVERVSSGRSFILGHAVARGYDSLEYAYRNLLAYRSGSLDPLSSPELCVPAYSCTRDDGSATKANSRRQCSRCAPTTPPGVPPGGAGATSCKMCAAYFGATPLEALCDDNDAY